MPARPITRRRALVVLASTLAFPVMRAAAAEQTFEWRGTALGADARLLLRAESRQRAGEAIAACVAEIERLEQIFSLYRSSSELSGLNRDGKLASPSQDMVRLLHLSREMNRITGGLFDPTVQPLWELYADWYAGDPAREAPPGEVVTEARTRVGIGKVRLETTGGIACDPGTRLTLNGIAQGYITDRVAELLRLRGWRHVLIDLGEVRALDGRPDGGAWQVGIREGGLALPLSDAALATSSGEGLRLGHSGRITHIFNPLTGHSPSLWRSVTAGHASAAIADALSTAAFAAPPDHLARIVRAQDGVRIWATRPDRTVAHYGS